MMRKISALLCAFVFAACSSMPLNLPFGSTTSPTVTPQTISAIVATLSAFNVLKQPLSTSQLSAIESYLGSTKSPDVMIVASMLMSDGVIPAGGLTPSQLAALTALLSAAGYTPVINGAPAPAA